VPSKPKDAKRGVMPQGSKSKHEAQVALLRIKYTNYEIRHELNLDF
jgi:hypothetical protein